MSVHWFKSKKKEKDHFSSMSLLQKIDALKRPFAYY